MRIVHVAEAWGGGVQRVVSQYVGLTPELEHHVIARPRADRVDIPELDVTEYRTSLPGFLLRAQRDIARLRPDVVHLHSSWAGLLRLMPLAASRIVYTPHAFAFQRRDLPAPTTQAFRVVERLAARRGVVAGCSPHECAEAALLGARTVYLPPPCCPGAPAAAEPGRSPLVVSLGRVRPQKDPRYFARLARTVRQRQTTPVRFRWIGGGDPQLEAVLRDAGVEVTGWLNGQGVAAALRDADLYVHTALWEGTPLSVIEAAQAGLPIVARAYPYADGLALPELPEPLPAAAERVRAGLTDSGVRAELRAASERLVAAHSPRRTLAGIRAAYGLEDVDAEPVAEQARRHPAA